MIALLSIRNKNLRATLNGLKGCYGKGMLIVNIRPFGLTRPVVV
jgi:hypothetical protein